MKKVLLCFSLLFLLLTGCSNFNQVNCSLTIPVAFSALNKSIGIDTAKDQYGYIIARIDGEYNKTQVIDVNSLINRGTRPELNSLFTSTVNINFYYVPVGKKIKISLIFLSDGQLGGCTKIATSKDFVLSKNKNIVELTFDDEESYDYNTVQVESNKLFRDCNSNLGIPGGDNVIFHFAALGQSGLYGIYHELGGWVSIGHFEGTRGFGQSYKFKEIAYKNLISRDEFSSLQVVEKPKYNEYDFSQTGGAFVSNSGICFTVNDAN